MISCSSCNKQNQDHYRFCLGCGAELPKGGPAAPAPEPVEEPTTMGLAAAVRSAPRPAPRPAAPTPAPEPPPAPELPPGTCPECQTENPPTNRFCASCGFKLETKKAAAAPPPKAKTVVPAVEMSGAVLVALDAEGNDIGRYEIPRGATVVGRESGGVFSGDAFLSPKHARLTAKDGRLTLRDEGSLNGVFRKLLAEQSAPLQAGQFFRIGQELLVFEPVAARQADEDGVVRQGAAVDGIVGRVSLVVGRKSRSPSVPVPAQGIHLGRERGDVTFSEDGYVSGLHCRISAENGQVAVTDLGSSNGTFIQLLGETELKNGDILLMGQQLYRVTL